MGTPATPTAARTVRQPLDGLRLETSAQQGPPDPPGPGADVVVQHLRRLGAEGGEGGRDSEDSEGGESTAGGRHITLGGAGFGDVSLVTAWGDAARDATDEATVQATTGMMAVHGRRDGSPRGLAVDYAATATGVLAVQGLLAGLFAQARGTAAPGRVRVSAERAGLLAVSQYLAAAGAEEGEAAELAPGGPPFTSSDGTVFELETLDPGVWAAFWRALGAPQEAIRRGWRPFQFRYATACAPFPPVLHDVVRAHTWGRIRHVAEASGADVCALRSIGDRVGEADGAAPWQVRSYEDAYTPSYSRENGSLARPLSGTTDGPLAGLTVLEAGRRIQAPLAAHLLGLLGADVVRVEPPGGDPLRGMPPACSGVSARWLALNRGKRAVEVDIKSAADRARLRELVAGADVFLHNWAPGKAAQLSLDRADLVASAPGLVYAYTSGWADRVPDPPMGTDFMVQARTGVGEAVRPADEPPAPSLMTLLDVLGGLLGAEAILAGLLTRERTGRGVGVESSLLGAADVLTASARARVAAGGTARRPAGFRRPLPTADGWLSPTDASAPAAAAYDLRRLPTPEAVGLLRGHGLSAAPVTTDLSALLRSPGPCGQIPRDTHGAPAVPAPWVFA
ncbi:CoA transferase [Streptomyces sp. NPDC059009]|uniref:CoA transferase n=1 Tax=Streptomyces sp. NPDC059009 TaxID=3346694 RepID=UPI0036B49A14